MVGMGPKGQFRPFCTICEPFWWVLRPVFKLSAPRNPALINAFYRSMLQLWITVSAVLDKQYCLPPTYKQTKTWNCLHYFSTQCFPPIVPQSWIKTSPKFCATPYHSTDQYPDSPTGYISCVWADHCEALWYIFTGKRLYLSPLCWAQRQ